MKNFLIASLIYISAFFASTSVANALTGMCVKDANGSIVISTAGRLGDQEKAAGEKAPFNYANSYVDDEFEANETDACQTQPLFYKIKFYKVALCTRDPYTGNANPDYSSCANIFNNASGKEIIIQPDAEVDLLDRNLLFPVGSFKYLTVVTSNHIHIKHKQKYVYVDATRAVMYGANDDGINLNTDTCYTEAIVTTYTGQQYNGDNSYSDAHGGVTVEDTAPTESKARMECVAVC